MVCEKASWLHLCDLHLVIECPNSPAQASDTVQQLPTPFAASVDAPAAAAAGPARERQEDARSDLARSASVPSGNGGAHAAAGQGMRSAPSYDDSVRLGAPLLTTLLLSQVHSFISLCLAKPRGLDPNSELPELHCPGHMMRRSWRQPLVSDIVRNGDDGEARLGSAQ